MLDPATGNPVADGQYEFVFSIYDSDTGGTTLWQETQQVTVQDGFFSVLLGNQTALSVSLFEGSPRYLGIKVEADEEMAPRQLLASVPYAFQAENADTLDGMDSADFLEATVPKGAIIMWSGTIDGNGNPVVDEVPRTDWHICDGTNGTPDLRDRFIVGSGGNYSVADTGGENAHTLTISEMPQHRHYYSGSTSTAGEHRHGIGNPPVLVRGGSWGDANGSPHFATEAKIWTDPAGNHCHLYSGYTDYQGGGAAHENRPPYYALAYIMRVS